MKGGITRWTAESQRGEKPIRNHQVCNRRYQCPPQIPQTLTIPAHASNRSPTASTHLRFPLLEVCGVNPPRSSFQLMANGHLRMHTQLLCWPEKWWLIIWVTPLSGQWFPCHLSVATFRRKHCPQWYQCPYIGFLLLFHTPISLVVRSGIISYTHVLSLESASVRTQLTSEHLTSPSFAGWKDTTHTE